MPKTLPHHTRANIDELDFAVTETSAGKLRSNKAVVSELESQLEKCEELPQNLKKLCRQACDLALEREERLQAERELLQEARRSVRLKKMETKN